jgi:hypothetical protein
VNAEKWISKTFSDVQRDIEELERQFKYHAARAKIIRLAIQSMRREVKMQSQKPIVGDEQWIALQQVKQKYSRRI